MVRTVGIGHQDFEVVRKEGCFYIDKTAFIREWWQMGDFVTLLTRPRRFGKTLNMSMVEKFFSVDYAGRGDLFQGLSIWKDEEYRNIQGTYPVLFLSFANVKETSFAEARKGICRTIVELYNKHDYLLNGNYLNEKERAFYQEVTVDMTESTAAASLRSLSGFLEKYYGKKTIILLDEYDTPMQEAYVNGYWAELISFTRSIFNAAFKTNPYLKRAILTGITRISRESIFSDLNNLEIVTTISRKYESAFGFTEQEVFTALDEFGLSDRKSEVKKWYDGFTFGTVKDIYNPWSIANYLDKRKLAPYWANSSSNRLAGRLIKEAGPDIKQSFETLMQNGTIKVEIDEQIIYEQLPAKKNAIWSLFLASGYVKAVATEFREAAGEFYYELALTNREVWTMFRNMIRDWFAVSDSYSDFIKALLAGDTTAMNTYMNRITLEIFSYFDTGQKAGGEKPERFYHGFVLGLMAELIDRYTITSNRESGFGRYDVMLEPKETGDDAIIIEFKVQSAKNIRKLPDTVKTALRQIEQQNYAAALKAKGISEDRIQKYGFAFCGKHVLIGKGS